MKIEKPRTARMAKQVARQPDRPGHSTPPHKLPQAAAGSALHIPPILFENDDPPPVAPATKPGEPFRLAPVPPAATSAVQPDGLPAAYGSAALLLAAREPRSLYAHWDLSDAQQAHYQSLAAAGHLVVRIQQEAPDAQASFDVHVLATARYRFIEVPTAGARYAATLGYYAPGDRWVAIASAAPVTTPPEGVSEDRAVQFATLPPITEASPSLAPMVPPAPPVPSSASVPTPPPAPESVAAPAPPSGATAGESLPDRFRTALEPCLLPPSPPNRPALTPFDTGDQSSDTEAVAEPVFPLAELTAGNPGEWSPVQERALAAFTVVSAQRTTGSSAELLQWSLSAGGTEAGAGTPRFAQPLAFPELLAGQRQSEPLGVSSPHGGLLTAPGSFWFNVNAELTLYGATEPGAQLTLAGLPVELRADGTFSCRLALPDGDFQVRVSAVSPRADDRREATLKLNRRTEHCGMVGQHPGISLPEPPRAAA